MKLIQYFFVLLSTLVSVAFAESLPQWSIVPAESSISFTAIQNGAPINGTFKALSGTITADPAKYQESSIEIDIQMDSFSVSYAELASILVTPEWFNVKSFPKATYKASKFNKVNDTTYQAMGTLTIKDKSVPTSVTFTATESPKNHWTVEGHTILKRMAFGIGTGEWANTDIIKDDVAVNFKIAVTPKK